MFPVEWFLFYLPPPAVFSQVCTGILGSFALCVCVCACILLVHICSLWTHFLVSNCLNIFPAFGKLKNQKKKELAPSATSLESSSTSLQFFMSSLSGGDAVPHCSQLHVHRVNLFRSIMDFTHPLKHVEQSGAKDLAGPSWMFFCTLWSLLTLVLIWGQMLKQPFGEKKERQKGLLAEKELRENALSDGQRMKQAQKSLISCFQ